MAGEGVTETLNVFEPADRREAVEGWALHATRRRIIHEQEARRLDRLRYWLGGLSTALAAIAGTSTFAAWQSGSKNLAAAIITAAIGIGAAVVGNVVAFLDLGGRAEAHRHAAVAYKRILREFEEATGNSGEEKRELDSKTLSSLKSLLAEADRTAPTVPAGRGASIERRPFRFVRKAEDLANGRRAL